MIEESRYYYVLTEEVFKHPKLSQTAKLLMALIGALARGDRGCFASNEYLAEQMGLSTVSIQTALAELKSTNSVKIKLIRHSAGTRRIISLSPERTHTKKTTGAYNDIVMIPHQENNVPHVLKTRGGTNYIDSDDNNIDICAPRQEHVSKNNGYSEEFNTLWRLYPVTRRDDKHKCFERYKKTVKSPQDHNNMVNTLHWYINDHPDVGKGFIKLATTWFNQWETMYEAMTDHQKVYGSGKISKMMLNSETEKARATFTPRV